MGSNVLVVYLLVIIIIVIKRFYLNFDWEVILLLKHFGIMILGPYNGVHL